MMEESLLQQLLVSDPDEQWSTHLCDYFIRNNISVNRALNGKEVLLLLYKSNFNSLIIDIETKNHSALEVIKAAKIKFPALKIILTFPSQEIANQWQDDREKLRALGVSDILVKPYDLEQLADSLVGNIQDMHLQRLVESAEDSEVSEEQVALRDRDVTKIALSDFFTGSIVLFDVFIRLGKNHYVKILHHGQRFDRAVLKKYSVKNVEHLYFPTAQRQEYIKKVNELLEYLLQKNSITTQKKFKVIKGVAQQYIDEVYLKGVDNSLMEEGNKIIDSIYHFLSRDAGVNSLLREFEEVNPQVYSHQFLVMFFSVLVCKNLSWVSEATINIVAQGAILHDIGKVKLPADIQNLTYEQMSSRQRELYKTHPKLGLELLDRFAIISESVKQIVYQHHELVTGEGFPLGLSGIKLYPLGKVVGFVNCFANKMSLNNTTPLVTIKEMIEEKHDLLNYDPAVVKALIKGFKKR